MTSTAKDIFAHTPHLFTIGPEVDLLRAFSEGLLALYGNTPDGLANITVFLPNNRAKRALEAALLKTAGTKALILPRMYALGGVAEAIDLGDDLPIFDTPLPPEMPEFERLSILISLIQSAMPGLGFRDKSFETALGLAIELSTLMDQMELEGLSRNALTELAPDHLAEHWQTTLTFLDIVLAAWPNVLKDAGKLNPAERRNRALTMLAESLEKKPPKDPLFIVGSTGSLPATAHLMGIVARLKHGAVILPGLDLEMPDVGWNAVEASHPQFMMKRTLAENKLSRSMVSQWPWPKNIEIEPEKANLLRAVNQALMPAPLTQNWRETRTDNLSSLEWIQAPSSREEAGVIALMMREALETPDKTVALVTPDRKLARRVKNELGRWNLEVDDSAGTPLLNTPIASLLMVTLDVILTGWAPQPFLSLMKHPYVAPTKARDAHLRLIRRIEVAVLRGPRPGTGAEGLLAQLDPKIYQEEVEFIEALKAAFAPLTNLANTATPIAQFINTVRETIDTLTCSINTKASVWNNDAARALDTLLDALSTQTTALGSITLTDFRALLDTAMARTMVRPAFGGHPRLYIWGTIEARLQRADLMILSGLVEGVWPPRPSADPWMSRPMRTTMGLTPLERRIGQSAHDFVHCFGANAVALTHAERVEGTPTVPSRWLFRMQAALGLRPHGRYPWLTLYRQLDDGDGSGAMPPPEPRPPVTDRPTKLSVTQIETLMRDPYAIYAQKILNLSPLEPVDAEPGPALKGIMFHDSFDQFLSNNKGPIREKDYDSLLEIGRKVFGANLSRPTVWGIWWPRFERAAHAFINRQITLQKNRSIAGTEVKAQWKADGLNFSLTARADRIDHDAEGRYVVVDYKTGTAPSKSQVLAGFAPQLPLEGMLLEKGAFKDLVPGPTVALEYWQITGAREPLIVTKLNVDVSTEIKKAEAGFRTLMNAFAKETTPYRSNPRPKFSGYGDYDHLARVEEWRDRIPTQNDGGSDGTS